MKALIVATMAAIIFAPSAFSQTKSLCGGDDRTYSYDEKIGRIVESLDNKRGCTATMISSDCAITAGHCVEIMNYIQFNVPHPQGDDVVTVSAPEDTFTPNKKTIQFVDKGWGKDWAVFKVNPNAVTGKLPGDIYGYYPVTFNKPKKRSMLRITGYGSMRGNERESNLQRTATGKLKGFSVLFGKSFTYKVDTEPGNSGSVVIDENTKSIIGIHTSGGCMETGGENRGTIIYKNKELISAIKSCLGKN
jgi:V8-like Glu-specific endopeptidase